MGTAAALTPNASTRTMSTLNNSIEAINIAKELVPLELAQGVLSTVAGILTLIRVCSPR